MQHYFKTYLGVPSFLLNGESENSMWEWFLGSSIIQLQEPLFLQGIELSLKQSITWIKYERSSKPMGKKLGQRIFPRISMSFMPKNPEIEHGILELIKDYDYSFTVQKRNKEMEKIINRR